jgi:tetratricopeptide (TPR) repeat protein
VFHVQRKFAESLEYQQRAQAIKERLLGQNDPDVAASLGNEALTLNTLGRREEALRYNQRAINIVEQTLGAFHPRVANELSNRGEILTKSGADDEALKAYEKAQLIWEHAVGPNDPAVAYALTGAGRSLVKLGRAKEALIPLRRALQIRRESDPDGARLGETEFTLAMAEWEAKRDDSIAVPLARSALAHYSQAPGSDVAIGPIKAWLAKHSSASLLLTSSR